MLERSRKNPRRPSRPAALTRAVAASAASPWDAPERRALQREVKRDAVILAAARAFQAHGYHNTSLDDLAAILRVTKPTLYHYVANKEAILFECFRTGLDQIRAGFVAAERSGSSARDKLAIVVRHYAAAITSDFGWCMVRAEDQDLSPAMGRRIKTLKSEIDQGLRRLVRAGVADGSIRACDPKMVAFALAGSLNWIGHWYRRGESLSPEEVADQFLQLFDLAPRARTSARSYNERAARLSR